MAFKINQILKLPNDLSITPLGIKTICFRLVDYTVTDLYTDTDKSERITLRRGKNGKSYIKYTERVKDTLKAIYQNTTV